MAVGAAAAAAAAVGDCGGRDEASGGGAGYDAVASVPEGAAPGTRCT